MRFDAPALEIYKKACTATNFGARIPSTMFAHRPVSWLNTITAIEAGMAARASISKTTTITG
ncbi:hypothetical protein HNP33_001838 [Comamonas odontotermitis]|uniref:Uncharacterized protein n=1 Tax=Comamonas odontotermitis TaxID=379895 RepID=A0ABR6RF43_9BURK|nr:hypothetical protein [Comamonas odontotermitis]MBB6577780.1 hypothetical protein [Comamonas odontotermitis]